MSTPRTAEAGQQAALLSQIAAVLCTRTLNQFAHEARLDGESLRDAVERYEVDYAWHVLASDRMRDETLAALALKLDTAAAAAQSERVSALLHAAAAQQPHQLLMSFDSDLPEQLAALLVPTAG